MNCPDREEIRRYAASELPPRRFSIAAKHVKECAACAEAAEAFLAETELLKRALADPPDVDRLIDRVLGRLRKEES